MKRPTLVMAVAVFGVMPLAGGVAFAQHGPDGGPGLSHGPSAASHGAMNSPNSAPHSAASASPTDVLSHNSKLDSKLTMKLQSKNLLPAGTDLSSACSGFRNLGQCIAAIHVSHNLNLSFACLKADMTGQTPATGSNCPTVAGSTSKMSLGKSIQALAPKANASDEAKTGTKQADSDIKEAESNT
jgi:hypothetical protein